LDQVIENKYLEYKERLPGDSDSEKKEFLADVSSFANASGGDLVYGIRTHNGFPTEFCGLQISSPDSEVSRLENIIRNGLAPRLPVHTSTVGKLESKMAIIIRARKSWLAPHMVTFKDHSKFYSRNSNGKYAMDVSEIRTAFLLTETIGEKVRRFRLDRVDAILSGRTPIPLQKGSKIVLHLIPFGAFDTGTKFDLSSVPSEIQNLWSPFLEQTSPWARYNFDGYLVYHELGQKPPISYLQIFRNGILEMVDGYLLHDQKVYSHNLEGDLLKALPRYFSVLRRLSVDPPVFVMLSMLGVSGFMIVPRNPVISMENDYPIDRENLLVSEVLVEEFEVDWARTMKPVFDAIWNAAGRAHSMNYDEKGDWRG
jgi:hypothetical protein